MNNKDKLILSKEIFFNLCNNKVDLENINFIDSAGATQLTWAIILGKYDMVKYLLEKGADTHIRVFPFVYHIIEYDWILVSAYNIFSLVLPEKIINILNIHKIKKILYILKTNMYINEKGIEIKYIPNICYEIFKFDCAYNVLLLQWDTQEKFDYKMKLTFWLYPKFGSSNNKYLQKFLKDPEVLKNIRSNMMHIFQFNRKVYNDIYRLIPLGTTHIEEYFNKEWVNTIIPEFLNNIIVKAICSCI